MARPVVRYAVGDVHGCLQTLDALVDRLRADFDPAADNELVFLGDYVDRGPDSPGVVERLLRLRDEVPCTFLRGNHEDFVLRWLDDPRGEAAEVWTQYNHGDQTLAQYGHRIPRAHEAFFRDTALWLDTPDALFVHAGLLADRTVADNLAHGNEQVFLWSRSWLDARATAWEKPVVCGHTPHPEPLVRPDVLLIDTGCVYAPRRPEYGRLTAVRLPDRHLFSEPYQE